MNKSILFIFILLPLISSCAQKVQSLKQDVDLALEPDAGYLLIGVQTNLPLDSILITGEKRIRLTSDDLRSGSQFILIDLPSGEYDIDQIKIDSWLRTILKGDVWKFNVSPGVISYVGNLDFSGSYYFGSSVNVKLENRSSSAISFLEQKFPSILLNRTVIYQGPGKDPFLEYVQKELLK